MKYIVTGVDGKLGGRVAELMLGEVAATDLIFTCPNMEWLKLEKRERWEAAGAAVRQANYDNVAEMTEAFRGGDRIYIVSAVTIGEIRVQQHKSVVDAAIAAGVQHLTYTSFLGASDPRYAHVYVTPDHTATEAYIRERAEQTGIKYNFMQDNLYLENYLTTSVMLALMSGNKCTPPRARVRPPTCPRTTWPAWLRRCCLARARITARTRPAVARACLSATWRP